MGDFRHLWWIGLIVVIILIGAVYTTDILNGDEIPADLASVEVRNYQGTALSSIYDFRENSIHGPQFVNLSEYRLTIGGMVELPRTYSYDEVLTRFPHYRKAVTLYCVEGWDVTILWEGVRLRDILTEARPSPEVKAVIFRAVDGYSTSLPLDYLIENDILLAIHMNNVTLLPERGFPFQLVAEDRWGYKWIKWVSSMELTDNVNYRGFWESRGYANNVSTEQPFFE